MGFARGRRPRCDRSPLLDSRQLDECHTPCFPRPSDCYSGADCSCARRQRTRAHIGPRAYSAASRAHASTLTCVPGPEGGRGPASYSRSDRAAHSCSCARCGAASRLAASCSAFRREALRSVGRRAGATTSACCRPARRSASAAASPRTGDVGSPGSLRAQEPRATGRGLGLFRGGLRRIFQRSGSGWAYRQPVDKFAQAAIVASTKKILLPSANCQIESASEAEGALKVSADCADSISYTSRSVMIALRSATELVYSASGDPALATTLKKCAP